MIPSKYSQLIGLPFLTASLVMLGGCSGGLSAKVSGTVTLDSVPLKSGNVTFYPASGDGAIAYGQTDAQGRYTLKTGNSAGIAPGKYVVTVAATGPMPETVPGKAPEPPQLVTPPRYNDKGTTDLKADVASGANDIPLKLTTNP